MADPIPTPQAAQAAAALRNKQQLDGIRAAAIKAGRQLERRDILTALGVQQLEDASQLAQLRAERDARPTPAEEAKHGRHRFWQGTAIGLSAGAAIGASMVALAFAWSMRESFNQAADYGSRMVVSGAALQAGSPPERCVPGETLPDGRVCP
jgi:hypothetical protein